MKAKLTDSKIRCVQCGYSKLDNQGVRCARCGGSPAVRWEQCYVDQETKTKIFAHAAELKKYGVRVEPPQRGLGKSIDTNIALAQLVLMVAQAIRPTIMHDLVQYLGNKLTIPEEQIIRLRLDDPQNISKALRTKKIVKKKKKKKSVPDSKKKK